MREIRFRVWDKRYKKYSDPFTLEDLNETAKLGLYRDGEEEDYIVEQYTGLLDKNGVEIYEGDICDWCSGRVIDYVELKDNDGWKMRDLYNINWWEDAKVIGNIHENPELLEGE